jgi:hypothetical protein
MFVLLPLLLVLMVLSSWYHQMWREKDFQGVVPATDETTEQRPVEGQKMTYTTIRSAMTSLSPASV